jgi:hypothetical protein
MRSKYFESFEDFLYDFKSEKGIWLLFIAENSNFKYSMLSTINAKCYGGVFPEIIFKTNHYKDGLVAIELEHTPVLIKDIKNHMLEKIDLGNIESMLVLVDGLSTHIESFLFSLFESLNEDCVLLGGGAGKLTLKQEKVIFTPEGAYQDAALMISFNESIRVGVGHGWEFLEGPFIATACDRNILSKIDYEDAYDVYKEIVEKDSGLVINDDNFFEISKSYPLGIVTFDNEVIVRDPISTKDGSLVLVGEIHKNSVINILKGSKPKLLKAAQEAAKKAYTSGCDANMIFMIDCISRVLYLEDEFKDEINYINDITCETSLVGALTLGEIANNSKTYIDFYNKTCVVGVLCSRNN